MGRSQSRTENEASVSDVPQWSVLSARIMTEKDLSNFPELVSSNLRSGVGILNFSCCPSLLVTIGFSKPRRHGRVTVLKDLIEIFCRCQLHFGNVFQGESLE